MWRALLALLLGGGLLAGACSDGANGPSTSNTSTSAPGAATTGPTSSTSTTSTPPRPTTSTSTTFTVPTTTAPVAPARRIYGGNPDRRDVALTFDAGSDAGFTAMILDTLRAHRIVGTFSITGRWAEANPGLLRRIAAEGHQLMNHSYDHRSFTGRSTGAAALSFDARRDEIERTDAAVARIAGVGLAPWFRPPYGDVDASVDADLGRLGYAYDVLWTVDSLGWDGLGAEQIARRCLDRAEPGAIYLFHVGSASLDAVALDAVIRGLRQRGYGFRSVRELLAP